MRILTSWKRLAPALLIALSLAPARATDPPTLSKEYIRLGGRILAIEQGASPGYLAPIYAGWNWMNYPGLAGWRVVGAGDFDGNGVPDLVWQYDATRQVTVNYYGGAGGAVYQGWAWLNSAGAPGWTVVAVADMNGDGVPDLIWQRDSDKAVKVDYYGGAGGAIYQSSNWLNQNNNSGWTVVAAADFDGNGTPDLVWQNPSTSAVTVDYYGGAGGAVYQGSANLLTGSASGWTVRAAADMNGDGVPDLLWENDSTGQVTVHFYGSVGGAVDSGWAWLRNGASAPGWRVAAVADFDGNGEPDLVWQHNTTPFEVTVNYYGPG